MPQKLVLKNRNYSVALATLSAFFYATTFFCIDTLWFMILPSIFLLAKVVEGEVWQKNFKRLIGLLAFWGSLIFALHFLWLPIMLRSKLGVPWLLTGGLYLGFIFLFIAFFVAVTIALAGAVFLLISCIKCEWFGVVSVVMVIMLMQSIQYCPILIIGQEGRYQLMSPVIACHAGIEALVAFFNTFYRNDSDWQESCGFGDGIFTKVNFQDKNAWRCAAHLQDRWRADDKSRRGGVIITPESWLPLPLNEHPQLLQQFINGCPHGGAAIIATQHREKNGDRYQALYWLDESGVRGIRRKRHAIAFVEKMPAIFEKCTILRSAFHADDDFAIDTAQAPMQPWFISGRPVVVYVCSEFFLSDPRKELQQIKQRFPACVVVVAANDSYFASYVVALLKAMVRMRQRQLGMPMVYVGYS